MDVPTSAAEAGSDTKELERILRAHIRTLEQRELSQMRQGAILQRKLDGAEQELREMRGQGELKQREAARQRVELEQQVGAQEALRRSKALEALEEELQDRLADAGSRGASLERELRVVRGRRCELEAGLGFWRRCGRELVRNHAAGGDGVGRSSRHRENHGQVKGDATRIKEMEAAHIQEECAQIAVQAEVLQRGRETLRAQLVEVERVADSARIEEVQLQRACDDLAVSARNAEASIDEARASAGVERQRELRLAGELEDLQARVTRERQKVMAVAGTAGVDDSEHERLRWRAEELGKQVAAQRRDRDRLSAALRRHACVEDGDGRDTTGPSEEPEDGFFGPADEFVSRAAMALFKSVLIRRVFCLHLAVLYSWLLFLLWWMSTRTHHGSTQASAV